ncbi:hypothetical protein D9619_001042 [Psilocybe cf. subviscida]|uniref:Nucleic acid-binding protein n=1 Tax=Psilocybe cf. subviscida TaxID=2480587 RepID=A0A8H5BG86_9AGAR|nr:hypothetical protein D9619_001042 [Psilocybe cf. subviscida]
MLSALRAASSTRMIASSAFAQRRAIGDMARLTLIGHLARDPELRKTKTDKDYVIYTIATQNYLPPNEDGERPASTATFHRVLSFRPSSYEYLTSLKKGTQVYAETAFEVREADPEADPTTPQGQRQVFLKHQLIRPLRKPAVESEGADESMSSESFDHTSGF